MALLSKITRYVPNSIEGNRDLPKDEQVVARLKTVDVYTKQLKMKEFMGSTAEKMTEKMFSKEGSQQFKEFLFAHVVGFDNFYLTAETDADGEPVGEKIPATIQDLWEAGEFLLCMELYNFMMNGSQFSKEEEKNSESQSGSTPTLQTASV